MSRSIARFLLGGVAPPQLLQTALNFAAAEGMAVRENSPGHVLLSKGSIWWAGRRCLRVWAQPMPAGSDVLVEAWVDTTFGEFNANPGEFLGALPRGMAWSVARRFVESLGIQALSVFVHA